MAAKKKASKKDPGKDSRGRQRRGIHGSGERYNWNPVYADYLEGMPPRELRKKYPNIPYRTLTHKIWSGGWAQERRERAEEIRAAARGSIEQRKKEYSAHCRRILEGCHLLIQSITEKIESTCEDADAATLYSLSAALGKTHEVVARALGAGQLEGDVGPRELRIYIPAHGGALPDGES